MEDIKAPKIIKGIWECCMCGKEMKEMNMQDCDVCKECVKKN
tara:strand:- start:70 stop:195 length:126 start_codon:yes stop_codon:yes gene_type:complete